MEDSAKEINKVRSEYGNYKQEIDDASQKKDIELAEMSRLYNIESDERAAEFKKR